MRKQKSGNTDICNQTTGVVLYDGETTVQRDKEVAIGWIKAPPPLSIISYNWHVIKPYFYLYMKPYFHYNMYPYFLITFSISQVCKPESPRGTIESKSCTTTTR